jgi:MFS family permease
MRLFPKRVGDNRLQNNSGCRWSTCFFQQRRIIADAIQEHKRGRAYGLTGLGYSIGATLGILAGGAIITFLTWRYIFFINVPIGFSAIFVTYLVLKDRSPHKKKRIDLVGMTSLGVALFVFLYRLTNLTGSGITTLGVVELLGSFALIIGFICWERYFSSPLLDLKMFRERVFTNSVFASFFQGLASYAVLFLVIMYLQGVRGMSPFNASLLLIPGYLLGGVLGPLGEPRQTSAERE